MSTTSSSGWSNIEAGNLARKLVFPNVVFGNQPDIDHLGAFVERNKHEPRPIVPGRIGPLRNPCFLKYWIHPPIGQAGAE